MPAAKRGDRRGLVGWTAAVLGSAGMVVGILGLSLGWGSTSTTAAQSGSTTTTATHEEPAAFLHTFLTALADGNTSYLLSRLDPAVIARYGEAQCAASIAHSAPQSEAFQLLSVQGPAVFHYTGSGRTTPVPDVYTFTVRGPVSGVQHFHFALVDGRFRWFTDCRTSNGG